MDLHEQLKPIAAEAARTGVPCYDERLRQTYPAEHFPPEGLWAFDTSNVPAYAARLIAEAGIAEMVAGYGVAVAFDGARWRDVSVDAFGPTHTFTTESRSRFDALRAAALRVYATLPDAAKGDARIPTKPAENENKS